MIHLQMESRGNSVSSYQFVREIDLNKTAASAKTYHELSNRKGTAESSQNNPKIMKPALFTKLVFS